jgi:hypothetical protein
MPEFAYDSVRCSVSSCGAIKYELIGGNTLYLTFDPTTRIFTLNLATHTNDVGPDKVQTVRAWPENYPDQKFSTTFKVSILPCTIIVKPITSGTHSARVGEKVPITF